MNYIRKSARELYASGGAKGEMPESLVYKATLVKKDTVIKTPFGDATITKGNYILTDFNGDSVGITEIDLENQFVRE